MTILVDPPPCDRPPRHRPPGHPLWGKRTLHGRRPRRPVLTWAAVALVAVLVSAGAAVLYARHVRDSDLQRDYLAANGWPRDGQAAYQVGDAVHVGPGQRPAPIASVAKVMTAYLVLERHPLGPRDNGPSLTVTAADVGDYEQRRTGGQSVVAVRAGERLTERQALLAVLLPSANNVAVMLARFTAGSTASFVARMNARAAQWGMRHTHYTDPSGFDDATVSTADDQLRLAAMLARDDAASDAFQSLAGTPSARLPVAGMVNNTNALLNSDGFVGTKTGSDDAAGGCFMFRAWRVVGGQVREVLGVVLGQRGRHAITAGLYAARQLADRIGPAASG